MARAFLEPDHYVFASERYGFDGEDGHLYETVKVWDLDPTRPMGSMKTAWVTRRKAAGAWYGLHDLRHTFISALGEAGVPESMLKTIAGWMLAKMLERHSHTRDQAKGEAVGKLPRRRPRSGSPQNPPQARPTAKQKSPKLLNLNGRRGGNRTHNPRLRRPVLYPIELLARMGPCGEERRQIHCSGNSGAEHSLPCGVGGRRIRSTTSRIERDAITGV